MSKYDVVIKKVEPLQVASLRGTIQTPPEQGILWDELEGYLAIQQVRPVGPCLSLYHDEEYKEKNWDIEVCEPLAERIPPSERIAVQALPAVETMACTIHEGSFATLHEAYDSIMHWLDENDYRIVGQIREVYLKASEDGNQMDPGTVTEIQIPVEKA